MPHFTPSMSGCCIALLLLGACSQRPDVADSPAPDLVARVQAQTVLPKTFQPQLAVEPKTEVEVPAAMLQLSEVVRPRAEVRLGPGGQYELADAVLSQGTRVMQIAAHGVWRKILVLGTWQEGWVHRQTLEPSAPSEHLIRVAVRHLPTVLVVHPVAAARGFTQATPLAVTIPRGTLFRELRRDKTASLVWLPETNSALWLSRKDVQ